MKNKNFLSSQIVFPKLEVKERRFVCSKCFYLLENAERTSYVFVHSYYFNTVIIFENQILDKSNMWVAINRPTQYWFILRRRRLLKIRLRLIDILINIIIIILSGIYMLYYFGIFIRSRCRFSGKYGNFVI